MAIYRTYECPVCLKCFDFLHHPNDEPPPNFCPLCGADVSGKKKRKKMKSVDRVRSPTLPVHRSGGMLGRASQSGDMVYRGMEKASEDRMQAAADILGVDRGSLSNMKMTNMRDSAGVGEQSYLPSTATKIQGSPVQISGIDPRQQISFQGLGGAQATDFTSAVRTGPEPFAGNRTREMIGSGHQTRAAQVARAGQLNKK